jgi:SAM-dependent methyltransferase
VSAGFACRSCGAPVARLFVDLGAMPSANHYLTEVELARPEPTYPLAAYVCTRCLLVQIPAVIAPEALFGDYAYFSSYAQSWVEHARRFAARARARFRLGPASRVVEIASNDGYLLQHFRAMDIPVLGVEPAANVAAAARAKGIPTEVRFFGLAAARAIAARDGKSDLVVANNVLAHVPDLNDFLAGLAHLVKPGGAVSIEVPHLLRLIEGVQFDTIYHEHFSYFSLKALEWAFERQGFDVVDVEELATHGGSLRLTLRLVAPGNGPEGPGRAAVRAAERAAGLDRLDPDGPYDGFAAKVAVCRRALRDFLAAAKAAGQTVAAYGAAAKGNTLLNACAVTAADIALVVDRNPVKQGRYLPGSRIPICAPEALKAARPDFVLILPWNLTAEIVEQHAYVRDWGGRFVVPVPEARVLP